VEPAGSLPQRIHLVGIGGIGLSALAQVLRAWGHDVSGSDLQATPLTAALRAQGIVTYAGHRPTQVAGAELVIISSAIPESNVEVQAARRAGVPVLKRQQLLGAMMAGRYGIGVAGTHGKTTTTAMIALLMQRLGLSPTFVVGGVVPELGSNAGAGSGPHFVIEADEYDHAFYGLWPRLAVVTNLEMDHPDCFRDLADLEEAFGVYLSHVPPEGAIIAGADSPALQRVLAARARPGPRLLTYGLSEAAAFRVGEIAPNEWGGVDFTIYQGQARWGAFRLALPGAHNALNATAALLVADLLGLDRIAAGAALAEFHGALRRFEVKGEGGGVTVVDDYAHHPTAVRATLAAARQRYAGRRLWVVFQPHTFSRTQALLPELATCFGDADEVIITDIYAARAKEEQTIRAAEVVAALRHPRARHIGALDDVVAYLLTMLRPGDVLLTLGAGDGYRVGERVLAQLLGS
jgi:UDP-N-acetylmuramate--alanine ligase